MTEQTTPLRVGIWAAVSSKAQAGEDKVSLKSQETQGRELAEALGAQVVAVYSVPGHSRDILFWQDAEAKIPAYRELREDIENGRLDVLFALDPDRLGRDPALAQQAISLVERNGAEVYFASSPHQVGHKSIAHRYISAIQSVRAGEDQALRTHRQKMGMKARVRRGLHPHRWPHGYRPVRDHNGTVIGAEFDPERIATVRYMTGLFLEGRSYYSIQRNLNQSAHRPPESTRWAYSTVQQILKNDVYAGFPSWGTARPETPSDRFPALWDPTTHAAIIRQRRRRRTVYPNGRGGPLTGVCYCLRCGVVMGRTMNDRRVRYLRCNTHAEKVRTGRTCHANYIAEARALTAVAAYLAELTQAEAREAALSRIAPSPDLEAELETQKRRIQALEAQRKRIALALAAGDMEVSIYREVDTELLERLEAARGEAAEIRTVIEALPDLDARRAALEAVSENFPRMLAEDEPVRASGLLQNAGIRVYIENGEVITITLEV